MKFVALFAVFLFSFGALASTPSETDLDKIQVGAISIGEEVPSNWSSLDIIENFGPETKDQCIELLVDGYNSSFAHASNDCGMIFFERDSFLSN